MGGSSLTHRSYQIGIICALAIEKAVVEVLLDEEHSQLHNIDGDENIYTFGRVHLHCVVIACLPGGSAGKVSAARVAKDMLRSFPAIKLGLMVGIGGGVWTQQTDLRLGDVVVSEPNNMHGGVVQWDFDKTERDGIFRRTGTLNKPPRVLLNAMQQLKIKHLKQGDDLSTHLSEIAAKMPQMVAALSYQGLEHDQLYQWDYQHQGGETCENCDVTRLVKRDLSRIDDRPSIHYGNIASGDQVMRNAATRDMIARQENVLCFEMEAAGLMDDFPCLVIRGVCDYADTHKNKRWQPYAAATAAAYAKELLKVLDYDIAQDSGLSNPQRAATYHNTVTFGNGNKVDDTH
ncbi:purine and uridine phosphorylase [Aureobasidium pullulans]|nr:purine and uridine phosphorylase [Aureobasidium pullulans]